MFKIEEKQLKKIINQEKDKEKGKKRFRKIENSYLTLSTL
jgi:hypothetical protein